MEVTEREHKGKVLLGTVPKTEEQALPGGPQEEEGTQLMLIVTSKEMDEEAEKISLKELRTGQFTLLCARWEGGFGCWALG